MGQMTRETKLGIAIAGSFLCLLALVVGYRLLQGDSTTGAPFTDVQETREGGSTSPLASGKTNARTSQAQTVRIPSEAPKLFPIDVIQTSATLVPGQADSSSNTKSSQKAPTTPAAPGHGQTDPALPDVPAIPRVSSDNSPQELPSPPTGKTTRKTAKRPEVHGGKAPAANQSPGSKKLVDGRPNGGKPDPETDQPDKDEFIKNLEEQKALSDAKQAQAKKRGDESAVSASTGQGQEALAGPKVVGVQIVQNGSPGEGPPPLPPAPPGTKKNGAKSETPSVPVPGGSGLPELPPPPTSTEGGAPGGLPPAPAPTTTEKPVIPPAPAKIDRSVPKENAKKAADAVKELPGFTGGDVQMPLPPVPGPSVVPDKEPKTLPAQPPTGANKKDAKTLPALPSGQSESTTKLPVNKKQELVIPSSPSRGNANSTAVPPVPPAIPGGTEGKSKSKVEEGNLPAPPPASGGNLPPPAAFGIDTKKSGDKSTSSNNKMSTSGAAPMPIRDLTKTGSSIPPVPNSAGGHKLPMEKGITVPQPSGQEATSKATTSPPSEQPSAKTNSSINSIPGTPPPPLPGVGATTENVTPRPINVALPPVTAARAGTPALIPVTDVQVRPLQIKETTTFEALSEKLYGSKQYAATLRKFNQENHPHPEAFPENAPLKTGDVVYYPDRVELESRFLRERGKLTQVPVAPPASVQGATNNRASTPLVPNTPQPIRIASSTPTLKTEPQAVGGVYLVRPNGEMLWEVARQTLGDGRRWPEIYRLNPEVIPEQRIPAGTQLRMPVGARTQ
jgi:hypothetical protein